MCALEVPPHLGGAGGGALANVSCAPRHALSALRYPKKPLLLLSKIKEMSKIGKLFKALKLIAGQPSLLNHIIDDNEVWKKYVAKKYGFENGLPVVELKDLFGTLETEIPTFAFLDGGSLPTDIALLMNLAKQIDNCSYFEIGTWRGESVVNVADMAKDCTTLNLPDDEMRSIGMSEEYVSQTAYFSKGKPNITHIRGNSKHFDFAGLDRKYDLIFIDGDHHYEMVRNDTQKVFAHLVHEDSVVVWHDYAHNPETTRFEVFAGILDGLDPRHHQYLYHAGNTLSAVYIKKQFPTHNLQNPTAPDHKFRMKLEWEDHQ